jgi:hypothetical protein
MVPGGAFVVGCQADHAFWRSLMAIHVDEHGLVGKLADLGEEAHALVTLAVDLHQRINKALNELVPSRGSDLKQRRARRNGKGHDADRQLKLLFD